MDAAVARPARQNPPRREPRRNGVSTPFHRGSRTVAEGRFEAARQYLPADRHHAGGGGGGAAFGDAARAARGAGVPQYVDRQPLDGDLRTAAGNPSSAEAS